MPTTRTQTIPIPLPENPEATAALTNFLRALEATGHCKVYQAVIVETGNSNAYRLIADLINPPDPEPIVKPEKNGHSAEEAPVANVYTDPQTGTPYTVGEIRQALRFKRVALGQQFTHKGKGRVEVYETEEGKYALRKVRTAEA